MAERVILQKGAFYTMSKPVLWIVIPCYNEEQVLPITAPMFLEKIHSLTAQGLVAIKAGCSLSTMAPATKHGS